MSIASLTISLDPQSLSCTLVLVAFESLVWTYLLRSWWYEGQRQLSSNGTRASTSAFARFSSPFHENFLVAQHTSAGVFHHSENS